MRSSQRRRSSSEYDGAPQPQIAPGRGRGKGVHRRVVGVRDAEGGPALGEDRFRLGARPRLVAELEGGARMGGQGPQELAQAPEVLLQVGRGLVEHGAELAGQAGGDGQEVRDLRRDVGQALVVRDALRGLEREGEAGRRLLRPPLQHRRRRHAVEGVVDLDRAEAGGVEREHLRVLHLLRGRRLPATPCSCTRWSRCGGSEVVPGLSSARHPTIDRIGA